MSDGSDPGPTGDFQPIGGNSESVYEIILQEMEDAVFLIDVEVVGDDYEFTFRRNNASHQQLTGLSEDEMRGQTPRELLGNEQGAAVAANYRRCVEQRDTIQYEETLEFPSGTTYWQTKLTPITDGELVTQIVGVARDITEQKERRQKLRQLDRQFKTVLETMSAAVFLKDTDGQYLLMNRACRELLDVDSGDVVGLTDEDLFPPEETEKAARDDRRVIENGEMIELEEEISTTTGNTVRLTRKSPVYDDNGDITGVCGVSTDITEQKERERELEYYEQIINTFDDIATVITPEGEITYVSPSVRRVLGYEPEDLVGEIGFEYQDPEGAKTVEEALEYVVEHPEASRSVQTKFRRTDGSWCWIEATIRNQLENDFIEGLVVNSRDITERKEYEQALERQRDELEVLNKIVRHDVRNQLQLVLAYGDILTDYVEGDGEKDVQRVLRAGREAVGITQTAGEITEAMLASKTDLAPMKLRPVLESQIENIQEAHQRALVSTEGPLPDAVVLSDEMLDAVFRNLLNNAIVHNDKELPEVTVSATTHEGGVRVRIADNGPGIPDQRREQIFEEGKKGLDSEGTGLGLYLVRTLVDRYGGAVWVEDNDPEGSVFTVELRCER